MAPLWLAFLCAFTRQKESDDEKALNKLTRRRTGVVFQRYDTNVDGQPIPQTNWLSSIWTFIRQSNGDHSEFIPQYRKLPLVSGLLVPFAILMEIPGLTEHWYVKTDPITHKPYQYQNNSVLLETGLAISMASAIAANACLISRFLERNVRGSTMLAMMFLTIHDIINIITVSIFGYRGRRDDGFTYAQAYWFTVASTIVSTVTNVTLLIDFIRTRDIATSGSGLTRKQRSLVIVMILLFSWVAIGAGCFSALLHISFQDSLYYTVVSMETIGFGDINPGNNSGARVFSIIFIATAILNLALAVTTIRDVVSEAIRQATKRRHRRAVRNKLRRERMRANPRQPEFMYHGGGRRVVDHTKNELHTAAPSASILAIISDTLKFRGQRKMNDDDENDDDSSLEVDPHDADRIPDEDQHLFMPRVADPDSDAEYRKEVDYHDSRDRLLHLGFALLMFTLWWLIGGLVFTLTESWGFGSAMYFCFIAYTTVGYGDLYPKTPAGRAIFVFWALLGVGGVTVLIAVIAEAYAGAFSTAVSSGAYDVQVYNRLQVRAVQARVEVLERRNAELMANKLRLEGLATDLIAHARTYHPHMRHVYAIDSHKRHSHDEPSRKLKELLLQELAAEDERAQHVILKHAEMRKTIFTLSYDRSFDRIMQSALTIAQYEADMADTPDAEPRRLSSATPRTTRPRSPTTDVAEIDMGFEDANPDLSAADNYVDNHVDHHVEYTVADVV